MNKVIYLNAGHSELQPGAVSRFGIERDLNIVIRDSLVPELEEQGFKVKIVPDDRNLTQSYLWVNTRTSNINDGLALSVHNNCCGGEGAESFYYGHHQGSKDIAEKLINAFCQETGLKNRGAKSDTITPHGRLAWIRDTKIWAVLIECGFMDSSVDIDFIINNIDIVCRGLAKGICDIYGVPYKEENPPTGETNKTIQDIIKILKRDKYI